MGFICLSFSSLLLLCFFLVYLFSTITASVPFISFFFFLIVMFFHMFFYCLLLYIYIYIYIYSLWCCVSFISVYRFPFGYQYLCIVRLVKHNWTWYMVFSWVCFIVFHYLIVSFTSSVIDFVSLNFFSSV